MVEALCRARGVRHFRTLTGFKWVMVPRLENPAATWVFGYEEALGYSVGDAVLDKDGIAAAVEFVRLAQRLRARGSGPLERLDELACELGVFETAQVSVPAGADAVAAALARLRAAPPDRLLDAAGAVVADVA
ncbi:MAG TPA: phosphomannomutase, partial [Acidimicrobiaceae bacterium]|nr:phosphomannomutase [Acidimicrobiaceae bacterium]